MVALSHRPDSALMQDLPRPARVMAGKLDPEFHREPCLQLVALCKLLDCALMQDLARPARVMAGYLDAEFHQEPGSKW